MAAPVQVWASVRSIDITDRPGQLLVAWCPAGTMPTLPRWPRPLRRSSACCSWLFGPRRHDFRAQCPTGRRSAGGLIVPRRAKAALDGSRPLPGRGDTETMWGRMWAGVPLAVRVVVASAVAVFVYGTAVHLDQLTAGGWHPYRELPVWLAGYFVALTVLDPVAAGLLACRRRAGLLLGCAVLLSDAAGNGYADYAVRSQPGITAGRVGQAVVTVLGVALVAVSPRIWPWLRPAGRLPDDRMRLDEPG